MPPLQAESVWVSNDSMYQDQYARAENLHPELQSYSYDVGLGAGLSHAQCLLSAGTTVVSAPTHSALSDLVGVSYPSPNTWETLNNLNVQVSGPFQYEQFQTPANVNYHYSNIYGPGQPTPVLPSCYALKEADLLASSTGVNQFGNTIYDVGNAVPQSGNTIYDVGNAIPQSGNTIYDVGNAVPQSGNTIYDAGNAVPQSGNTIYDVGNAVPQSGNTIYDVGNAIPQSGNTIYDVGNAIPQSGNTIYDVGNAVAQSGNTIYGVGNAVPQSYMPLLSQSTFLGLPIDTTAEVSIAPPHPTSANEILPDNSRGLHGPIQHTEPNTCQKCRQSFPSTAELERHAKSLYHDAFECKCGKHYARLDTLKRHWNQTPKFPCPHCNKHTGINAFARKDHLTQHLQTYHRHNTSIDNQGDTNTLTTDTTTATTTPTMEFCTFPNCTHHKRSFKIKSQVTDHMRRMHNYSPFPCLVQGCVKIGGKGYFRERDLFKHSQEVHSVEN